MIEERPVWVTIPTIGYSPLLIPLVNELERDSRIDRILLTVNLQEYVEPVKEFFRFAEPNIKVLETWPQGRSIHYGWNLSMIMAQEANAWLAVLNDDIHLFEPNAISTVARLMSDNRDYAIVGLNWQETPEATDPSAPALRSVTGSYRHYGVGGFAWVCDPHRTQRVPEELVHWGGEDHIIFQAQNAGYKIGIANHVHVEHSHPETTAKAQEWTQQAKEQDRITFDRLYPGRSW